MRAGSENRDGSGVEQQAYIDVTRVVSMDRKERSRRMQYSSNRGGARHTVRYVESSAPPEGECMLCVGSLADAEPVQWVGPVSDPRPLLMQWSRRRL